VSSWQTDGYTSDTHTFLQLKLASEHLLCRCLILVATSTGHAKKIGFSVKTIVDIQIDNRSKE
jgi:hypothetical protein